MCLVFYVDFNGTNLVFIEYIVGAYKTNFKDRTISCDTINIHNKKRTYTRGQQPN